ncbi:MAG: methyltransferase domain-containing protein [Pseudomonadota bacterium]
MKENLDRYSSAYSEAFPYHNENLMMQEEYASRIVEGLQGQKEISLLGLGIGHSVVFQTLTGKLGDNLSNFTLVEGSADIIDSFKMNNKLAQNIDVVEGYFENFSPDEKFDAIEMGFVLEHVDSPDVIIERYARFLKDNGKLFMAVPNARSLNRQIGHAGGLLDDLHKLSEYDHQLGHKRYFDKQSFESLAKQCGLAVIRTEGILLKPLTTAQLQKADLPNEAYLGMNMLARGLPDMALALFMEAKLTNG